MPIYLDSNTNTRMVIRVAEAATPAPGESAPIVVYTLPARAPDPSGLLQCDSEGNMRWVTNQGVAVGESRHYSGSFKGQVSDANNFTALPRVNGNGNVILVPNPSADPAGMYVEGVLRAYSPSFTKVSTMRLLSSLLYSGGAWSIGGTSFFGNKSPELVDVQFGVSGVGQYGALVLQAKARAPPSGGTPLTIDVDATVFGIPGA